MIQAHRWIYSTFGLILCLLSSPFVFAKRVEPQERDEADNRSTLVKINDEHRDLILELSEFKLSTHTWSISAEKLISRFGLEQGLTELKEVHFSPCREDLHRAVLYAQSATLAYGLQEEPRLMLTEPKLLLGNLKLPLPSLTLNPKKPEFGVFYLSHFSRRTWLELGPSVSLWRQTFKPTILYAQSYDTEGNSIAGLGLRYHDDHLTLASRQLWSLDSSTNSSVQVEARGGRSIFAAHGGFTIPNGGSIAERSILSPQFSSSPKRLWTKLSLYESDRILSGLNFQTHEDETRLTKNMSWSSYLRDHYKRFNNDAFGLIWSGAHRLQTLPTSFNDEDQELIKLSSLSSFILVPYYRSKVGEWRAYVGADLKLTEPLLFEPSFWVGGDYELTLIKNDHINVWRHQITFNPSLIWSLADPASFTHLETLSERRGGIAVNQRLSYYRASTLELFAWGGISQTFSLGNDLIIQRSTSIDPIETTLQSGDGLRPLGILRLRLNTPYILAHYSTQRAADLPLESTAILSLPIGHISAPKSKRLQRDFEGRLSLYYYAQHSKGGLSDLSFKRALSSAPIDLSERSASFITWGHIDPFFPQSLNSIELASVLLSASTRRYVLGLQLSMTRSQDQINRQKSTDQVWRVLSSVNSLSIRGSCGCWYVSIYGGIRSRNSEENWQREALSGLRFGLGEPPQTQIIDRALGSP